MKRISYPLYSRMNPVKSETGETWPRGEMHEFAKAVVVGNLAFLSGVSVEPGEARPTFPMHRRRPSLISPAP